jgi:hypothetical protein
LAGLLDRLGISETIKSKVTRPESDIVSEPRRRPRPGQLIGFLRSPAAIAVIKAQGMECTR